MNWYPAHPGDLTAQQCCSYALRGAHGWVLIDPGGGFRDAELRARLAALGGAPEDVRAVLLTHGHVDHARGAGVWRDRGARLLASPLTAESLERADGRLWREHPEQLAPTPVDEILADGQALAFPGLALRCLATPGHTPGSLSYVLTAGAQIVVFSGDLLMSDGNPGWAGDPDFSVTETLRSLRRLAALEPTVVAHGHAIVDRPGPWLREGIRRGEAGEWVLKR